MGNQESNNLQCLNKEYKVNSDVQTQTTNNSSYAKIEQQINKDPIQDEFIFKDGIDQEENIYSFLGKPPQIRMEKDETMQESKNLINSKQQQNLQKQAQINQLNQPQYLQDHALSNIQRELYMDHVDQKILGTQQMGISPKIIENIDSIQNTQISIEEFYQPWLKQKLQMVGKYQPPEKFEDEQSEFKINYQIDNKQRYQGFMKKDIRHGYGINLTQSEYFEGSFQEGVRRGWGRRLTQNTQESGYWEIDKIQRNMEIHTKDVFYNGQCLNSMPHGKGILRRHGISTYIGYFVQGQMEGKGYYEDLIQNTKYDGDFQGGNFHGLGTYYFASGKKYVGQFKNSQFNGQGEMFWPNNSYYKGQFVNGLFHGQGYFYNTAQQSIYDGQWNSGKRNGKGKHTDKGIEVIGFWQNDVLQEDY